MLTVTAPSAWASALINFDYSGLTDADTSALNRFLLREGLSFSDCVDCEDAGFCWTHDATPELPLGADCQRYTFRT